jgi:hypothetical protein
MRLLARLVFGGGEDKLQAACRREGDSGGGQWRARREPAMRERQS